MREVERWKKESRQPRARHRKFPSCLLCAALAFLQLPFWGEGTESSSQVPDCQWRINTRSSAGLKHCRRALIAATAAASSVWLQATQLGSKPRPGGTISAIVRKQTTEALCNGTKDCKLPRHFLQGHWFLFIPYLFNFWASAASHLPTTSLWPFSSLCTSIGV